MPDPKKPYKMTSKEKLNKHTYNALASALGSKRSQLTGKPFSQKTLADLTKDAKRLGLYQDARIKAVSAWRKENAKGKGVK